MSNNKKKTKKKTGSHKKAATGSKPIAEKNAISEPEANESIKEPDEVKKPDESKKTGKSEPAGDKNETGDKTPDEAAGSESKKQPFVPMNKQSKLSQKEFHASKRGSWGGLNPVTRTPPNPKAYNRRKTGR